MQPRDLLLRRLSDGRFHSGEELAVALGRTRSAVWKQLRQLSADAGLDVQAVRGRGYRLAAPLELLDPARLRQAIGAGSDCLETLDVLSIVASTNRCAAESLPPSPGQARVWLAEHQTAGRGRRGRQWVSAFGSNLYLSLAWRFDLSMAELGGLSLAAGVALAEVLQELGLDGHLLKWPNDILLDGRKLSGILLEASGEADGPSTAIIGVGVNVRMPAGAARSIDQPWVDLAGAMPCPLSRNQLAGRLIVQLIETCQIFAREGLTPFLSRWAAFDPLPGRRVRLLRGDAVIDGIYRGIASSGALLLETPQGCSEHHAGEVSLRGLEDR